MDRQLVNSRIFNFIKGRIAPDYRLLPTQFKTKYLGKKGEEVFFYVEYFCLSIKYVGGLRTEKVSVNKKRVKILEDE